MTPLRPRFEGPAAAASVDPLAAAGPAPRLDLDTLARLLSPPATDGEYLPGSCWAGVRRLRATPPTPGRGPGPSQDNLGWDHPGWRERVRGAFAAAVADTTAGHRRVAVALSGGLDSLAVLLAARAHCGPGNVVAISIDLIDDTGRSAAGVAAAQIDVLAPDCGLYVIDPAQTTEHEPPWSPLGPRLDALPALNATVNALAARHGAGVVLSGDGSDEHLGVPRYATAAIARTHGPRGAARYLADLHRVDTGLGGEALAAAGGVLPATTRGALYWAASWPEWCHPVAPAVLAEPHRTQVSAWAQATTRAARRAHATAGRSWAEADAFDAIHPHDPIPAAGPVPEASPFLAASMLEAAYRLPLARRYDPAGRTAYQRAKAAVLALLDGVDPAVLPAAKQHYAAAITGGDHDPVAVPELHRAGLLVTDRLDATNSDPATRRAARAVETWLAGAHQRGFQ